MRGVDIIIKKRDQDRIACRELPPFVRMGPAAVDARGKFDELLAVLAEHAIHHFDLRFDGGYREAGGLRVVRPRLRFSCLHLFLLEGTRRAEALRDVEGIRTIDYEALRLIICDVIKLCEAFFLFNF